MTLDAIIQAIKNGHGVGCVAELQLELERGAANHLSSGEMPSHAAAAIWRIRHWTTERAGTATAGLADAVRALAGGPKDAPVALVHFKAPGKLFTVFATPARVLACIRVSTPPRDASPKPA